MDGILCYSPDWDSACKDCMFQDPGGCKSSPAPNVGLHAGVIVCDDYIKRPSEGTCDE